jgi:hypothetical protein
MSVSGVAGPGPGGVNPAAGRNTGVAGQLEALLKALESGDAGGARSAYARLRSSLDDNRGSGGIGPESPLGQLLGRIGNALQTDDLAAATAALTSFSSAAGAATVPTDSSEVGLRLQTGFVALLTALDAGNLPAARQACAELQRLTSNLASSLTSRPAPGLASGSADGAAAAASGLHSLPAPAPTNPAADPLRALLGDVADALVRQDFTTAQQAVAQFFDRMGRGCSLTAALDEWVQARAAEQAAAAAGLPALASPGGRGARRGRGSVRRSGGGGRLGLRIGGLALFVFVLVFGPDRCHADMAIEEFLHPAPRAQALGCRIQPPIHHGSVRRNHFDCNHGNSFPKGPLPQVTTEAAGVKFNRRGAPSVGSLLRYRLAAGLGVYLLDVV